MIVDITGTILTPGNHGKIALDMVSILMETES